MTNVPNGPLPDLYPPSQITDLQATLEGEEISVTWTAPGDDYDVGTGKNKDPVGLPEVRDVQSGARADSQPEESTGD